MSKLRELIPDNPILSKRYEALSEFEKSFLLGSMAGIDGANRDLVRYYPTPNEIYLSTTCSHGFITTISVVMDFFKDAFPEEWEDPDHRPIGES